MVLEAVVTESYDSWDCIKTIYWSPQKPEISWDALPVLFLKQLSYLLRAFAKWMKLVMQNVKVVMMTRKMIDEGRWRRKMRLNMVLTDENDHHNHHCHVDDKNVDGDVARWWITTNEWSCAIAGHEGQPKRRRRNLGEIESSPRTITRGVRKRKGRVLKLQIVSGPTLESNRNSASLFLNKSCFSSVWFFSGNSKGKCFFCVDFFLALRIRDIHQDLSPDLTSSRTVCLRYEITSKCHRQLFMDVIDIREIGKMVTHGSWLKHLSKVNEARSSKHNVLCWFPSDNAAC